MTIIAILGLIAYVSAVIIKTAAFIYLMHLFATFAREKLYQRTHYKCEICDRVATHKSNNSRVCFEHIGAIWRAI